jgi:lysyl-tRNA synthetase class 2
VKTVSYRDALLQHAEIDPMTASDEEVVKRAAECGVYEGIDLEWRDGYLNVILGSVVEPQLGRNGLTVLMHYPPSQAALAQTAMCDGFLVAERFEIYYRGVELANGYHELSNSEEQRSRFIEANALRIKLGKNPLPIDEAFLKAVDLLPDCCGVSVGFDRVQMLRRGKTHLQN